MTFLEKVKSVSPSTWGRAAWLGISLINQILLVFGKSVLPIQEEEITLIISTVSTIASALVAWWYNNSFTQAAIQADKVLVELKEEVKE